MESTSLDEQIEKLSHEDLCEITVSSLKRLLHSDPLLSNLPSDVTIEEVTSQIAVAQGRSITVQILRHLDSPLSVVIPQHGTTVRDLKKAIRRCFELRQQRNRSRGKISWKYVWRTYNLQHDKYVMKDNNAMVADYGVANKSEIKFVKRLRRKYKRVITAKGYPWLDQISRQETLMSGCDLLGLTSNEIPPVYQLNHMLVDHVHKLIYCYVPKVACTNWKRVLLVLTGRYNTTNLASIPATMVHANNSLTRLSEYSQDEAEAILKGYMRFVMVRHPFERLLSAYRNKLEGNLPSARYFQARFGKYIIKNYRPNASNASLDRGDDVSFSEFIQYLTHEGMANDTANEHWKPIHQLCYPCTLNYTLIGKYEKFVEDSELLLNMIQAPLLTFPQTRSSGTANKVKQYFQQLSINEMESLFRLYEVDFRLFGYDLEDILGFDIG